MRKIYAVLIVAMMFGNQWVSAQCSQCTPVFSTCPPAGGLCGHLDTAYANHAYDKVINFYMPKVLTDPSILSQCSCNEVHLRHITVTGVSGLPTGVGYSLSHSNGYYDVSNGDSLGCSHFCGTPLVAGLYPVTVYLSADVTAIGTPIGNVDQNNVAQHYMDTLLVLPDTTAGVSSFTYGNNGFVACDSITITLNALLAAPQPNLTRYFWNINGQTTEVKTPGSYTFTNHSQTPDTIPVTLTTVFYNYEVKNVHIANVTGGYCGDVEEVQCSCVGSVTSPDPYIKLPLLGYQSSYVSNTCTNVNFNGINQLIPLGLDTLVMQIWDADNGPPFGSQDDLIGNYTLHVSLNQYNYADNNADGFVTFDTVAGTSITETLNVIVNPTPPMPVVVATQDTFCNGDSVLLSLDTSATYNGYAFNWYRDTVYLTDVTDSAFYTSVPGAYKVIVNNLSTGCMNESGFDTITRVQSPQSPVQVVNAGSQLYVTPFAAGLAVAWYYNGALVPGQSGSVISYLGDGTYQAVVYTRVFPGCSTESAIDTVVTSGISDLTQDYGLSVIPNPNNGKFQVLFNATQSSNFNIYIRNLVGQTVFSKSLGDFAGKFMTNVDLGSFAKGVYVVTVESEKGSQNVKLIVQ